MELLLAVEEEPEEAVFLRFLVPPAAVVLRPVFLRAVVLRPVVLLLAEDLVDFLRVDLRPVVLRPVVLRPVDLRLEDEDALLVEEERFFVRRVEEDPEALRRWSLNMACLLIFFSNCLTGSIGKKSERL